MKKSVDEIISETGLKRGTVENFRSKLQELGILSNHESLNETHIAVLKKIKQAKTDSDTWEKLMDQFIMDELRDQISTTFSWTSKIVIRDLIWKIEKGYLNVDVMRIFDEASEDSHVFCCIIDNFVELGTQNVRYAKSAGTDGNAVIFKLMGQDEIFYVIGKLNRYNNNEDVHIFYNDGSHFNIMKCQYIYDGDDKIEPLKSLMELIYQKNKAIIENHKIK